MNLLRASLLLSLFLGLLSVTGCKTKEKVKISGEFPKLENKSTKTLIELMKKNEFTFNTMSAKMNVDAEFDGNNQSFNATIRCRKDSAIWISISPALGIEVARLLVTKDSVKLRNGLKKTYFVGDYNYLSKLLNTDLDYDMLESLILGNSVSFYDEEEKLRSTSIYGNYILSTIRKRKLKKMIRSDEMSRDLAQIIWLEPVNYRIDKISFSDPQSNRSFIALYSNLQKTDSLFIPMKGRFEVHAEKMANINFEYSKINLNTPLTYPFSIPESYERKQ